jgi:major type 1 subunit fimbrin (pilin)
MRSKNGCPALVSAATVAAIGAAIAAALASPVVQANTGLITFNGQVTDSTCDVRGGTSGAPSFAVALPIVSAHQLQPGDTVGRTQFRMSLENCTAVANGVRAYFEDGPDVDKATGTLRTGIPDLHLALFDADGTQIGVGAESQRDLGPLYQAGDTMDYQVAYQNFGVDIPAPGLVAASVVYSLHYP